MLLVAIWEMWELVFGDLIVQRTKSQDISASAASVLSETDELARTTHQLILAHYRDYQYWQR